MDSEEQVRKFLYEVYGYSKIEEFIKGKKEKELSFREFFRRNSIRHMEKIFYRERN